MKNGVNFSRTRKQQNLSILTTQSSSYRMNSDVEMETVTRNLTQLFPNNFYQDLLIRKCFQVKNSIFSLHFYLFYRKQSHSRFI